MLSDGMVKVSRIVYAALAWIFLAALVAQVFFAGLMLFGGANGFALHSNTGWLLHVVVILVPIAAALARAGARAVWLAVALTVATGLQPYLALLRETPAVAALHPVNAVLLVVLALLVARDALRLTRIGAARAAV